MGCLKIYDGTPPQLCIHVLWPLWPHLITNIASGQILCIFTICLWPYCRWVLKGATVLQYSYSFTTRMLTILHFLVQKVTYLPTHCSVILHCIYQENLSCILLGKADMKCILLATTLDFTAISGIWTTSIHMYFVYDTVIICLLSIFVMLTLLSINIVSDSANFYCYQCS